MRSSNWRMCTKASLLALFCTALACGGGQKATSGGPASPSAGPPSLLLVTVDTWRWDYIGVSGTGKVLTPALDRLARGGVYEAELETPCPLTTPAHATLFTGLLPLNHKILDCVSYGLPAEIPTLAQAFKTKGYATAAFVSSQTLIRHFGLDRGFDHYDDSGMDRASDSYWQTATRDGAVTSVAVLDYLRAQAPSAPLFLWVHYFDLHLPHSPRPAYDAKYPDSYAAQVAFVDDQIATLLSALESDSGRAWRVLVVGDHGEGLGDHGEPAHGFALYRSTLHVPLILYPKPDSPLLHSKPWRMEDLDATVREWFGLGPPGTSDGGSLFGRGSDRRLLPSSTLLPSIQFTVNPCLGMRKGNLMYMRHGFEEVYDLASDPEETRNLARDPRYRSDLEALRTACDAAFPVEKLQIVATPTVENTPVELQGLQGLGYVGGFVPPFADLQPADIHRVMEDDARFEHVRETYRKDRNRGPMLDAYRTILGKYPRAAPYWKNFGLVLLQAGDQEEALRAFRRAVQLNPRDAGSLVNLGSLYLIKGDVSKAKVLFESALVVNEANPVAHKNLGIIYAQNLEDSTRAVAHYKRYLELLPDTDAELIREYVQRAESGR